MSGPFKITACTTAGHLLVMSHKPQTRDSAKRWAGELSALPCIRHVIIAEEQEWIIETIENGQPGVHDELVAAAKASLDCLATRPATDGGPTAQARDKLRAALARARGEYS